MRDGILWQVNRKLTRGAAVLLVGGLAAGCSSQVDRFSDSLFTGSTYSGGHRTASVAEQPYPGDRSIRTAQLDATSTGSVDRPVGRPDVPVGGGGAAMQTYSQPQSSASLPAPSSPAPVSSIQREPIAPPQGSSSFPVQGRTRSPSTVAAPAASSMPSGRYDDRGRDVGVSASKPRVAETRNAQMSGDAGSRVTIQPGDTVYGLSHRFNVPSSAILAANGMKDGSDLQVGQTLLIPKYAYSVDASASGASGETRMASVEPTPAERKPDPEPKQTAVLQQPAKPEERPEAPMAREDAKSAPAGRASYTVVSGDTLYGISKKTGVSVGRLKDANDLSSGQLSIGQTLAIPAAGETVAPTVAKADEKDAGAGSHNSAATDKEQKVASYTPPKEDSVGSQVNDDKEAAAPDSTGIGKLRWPVRGRVISAFGTGHGSASSDGIDIAVPEGTPVKAAENGVVIYAGDGLKEFGKTVLVRHDDGLVTVYGYTGDIKVGRGDKVKRGQEIATSGMTGSADRPKLHFEVRKNATPVDPKSYLD